MENKSRGEKIQIFCSKYLLLFIAILILIIGIFSLVVTAYFENATYSSVPEKTNYRLDNFPLVLLGCLIFLLILFSLYKITKKIKIKWLLAFCIIIIVISQLLWVNNLKFIPRADQASIIGCAKELLQRNFDNFGDPSSYFGIYPFQLGIIYYIALVFKVFNTTKPLILQILNVIFSAINILLMYSDYIAGLSSVCQLVCAAVQFFCQLPVYGQVTPVARCKGRYSQIAVYNILPGQFCRQI